MRFSFICKAVATGVLVALFDRIFPFGMAGAGIGVFAGVWLLALIVTRPDVRRRRAAWAAAAFAALFAVALFTDPGLLAWSMFWAALSVAALLPRTARLDDAGRWALRLLLHGLGGPFRLIVDLHRLATRPRARGLSARAIAATLALPVIGGAVFVALFAAANPLVAQAFADLSLPPIGQVVTCSLAALCVWPALRPSRRWMARVAGLPAPNLAIPGTSLSSVTIGLGVFNLIFAVQNALDIAFLWSGGSLPDGISAAEYVHRGAYPLIATALIAGVMALAMLRPGSASAADPWARRLVTLWVAQNVVLVASSALRTIDYIDASMLTAWRIAALLWMGLVALGLVLIGWRILAQRSARWLINGNALAAGIVLTACCFVDLGAIAARYNVQAKTPAAIDLCYLDAVGDGALLPLLALERRALDPVTRGRVRVLRERLFADLTTRQARWESWTPVGARRLTAAQGALAALGPVATMRADLRPRYCDGTLVPLVRP